MSRVVCGIPGYESKTHFIISVLRALENPDQSPHDLLVIVQAALRHEGVDQNLIDIDMIYKVVSAIRKKVGKTAGHALTVEDLAKIKDDVSIYTTQSPRKKTPRIATAPPQKKDAAPPPLTVESIITYLIQESRSSPNLQNEALDLIERLIRFAKNSRR